METWIIVLIFLALIGATILIAYILERKTLWLPCRECGKRIKPQEVPGEDEVYICKRCGCENYEYA